MCRWAYLPEILIPFFFPELHPFKLRNLTKMKDATETVCKRNSSETAKQNFVKLCSYKGLNVEMCISTGNSDSIYFSGKNAPF